MVSHREAATRPKRSHSITAIVKNASIGAPVYRLKQVTQTTMQKKLPKARVGAFVIG